MYISNIYNHSFHFIKHISTPSSSFVTVKYKWEMTKAESGKLQKEIGQRAKEKKPFDDLKQQRVELEAAVKALEPELAALEHTLHQKLNKIGNIVHSSVTGNKWER